MTPARARTWSLAVLIGAGGAVGCKEPAQAPAAAAPRTVTIDAVKDLSGAGYELDGYGVRGRISSPTVDLTVPRGTTATLDGRPLPVSGTILRGPFALGDSAGELDLAAVLDGKATVTLQLALALAGGVRAEVSLPLDARSTKRELFRALGSVTRGPLRFGAEPPAAGPARNLLWVHTLGGTTTDLRPPLGHPAKVKDVDLIAFDAEDVRAVPCPREYTDGARAYTVNRQVWTDDVRVFDRRTGKQVGARKFEATPPRCTRTTTGDFYAEHNQAAIGPWLQGLLAE